MVRGAPQDLAAYLVSVGDAAEVSGTRAVCRTHFLISDANGRPRLRALAEFLAHRAVDYCIPRSRINEAVESYASTGSTRHLVRLAAEARDLFAKVQRSGEGGELLLYALLESVLGVPQLLCKMSLKTDANVHVQGTDGVHAKVLGNGNLAIYWGESKVYRSAREAIDECFSGVAPYLTDTGGGAAERDLLLVRDNLDAGAEAVTTALIRYFMRDRVEAASVEFRAGCLVAFDMNAYPTPFDEVSREIRADVLEAMTAWQSRVGNRVGHHGLAAFEIEVFFIPVPSADEFRQVVREALGLT